MNVHDRTFKVIYYIVVANNRKVNPFLKAIRPGFANPYQPTRWLKYINNPGAGQYV